MKRLAMMGLVAAMLGSSATAFAARADRRERHQQERIAQGVQSGQLTPGETGRLEAREQRIDRQVSRERAENGGKLTPAERRQVNREQNRTSRAIYRDKHNARAQ